MIKTTTPLSKLDSRWNSLQLKDGETATWGAEELTIYAQRLRGDWMLASTISTETNGEHFVERVDSLPLGLEWKRWAFQVDAEEIRFWPTLPDRPLIVKTRLPVIIPPGASVDLYINIPIWVEVTIVHKKSFQTLDRFAPSQLSSTWHGSLFEGQLCYALKSRARRSLEDLESESMRSVCKFHIHNRSSESLPVEKIRALPEHLSLYNIDDRLWSSSINVEFNGKDEKISVEYETKTPDIGGKAKRIREAAKPYRHTSIIDTLFFRNHNSND